jgi:hypothetical protein
MYLLNYKFYAIQHKFHGGRDVWWRTFFTSWWSGSREGQGKICPSKTHPQFPSFSIQAPSSTVSIRNTTNDLMLAIYTDR